MSEKIKRKKKVEHLNKFSTVDIGDTCKLIHCCREVRLGATPLKEGKKLEGYNTLSDGYEEWIVIKINKKNQWFSIVKRVV